MHFFLVVIIKQRCILFLLITLFLHYHNNHCKQSKLYLVTSCIPSNPLSYIFLSYFCITIKSVHCTKKFNFLELSKCHHNAPHGVTYWNKLNAHLSLYSPCKKPTLTPSILLKVSSTLHRMLASQECTAQPLNPSAHLVYYSSVIVK